MSGSPSQHPLHGGFGRETSPRLCASIRAREEGGDHSRERYGCCSRGARGARGALPAHRCRSMGPFGSRCPGATGVASVVSALSCAEVSVETPPPCALRSARSRQSLPVPLPRPYPPAPQPPGAALSSMGLPGAGARRGVCSLCAHCVFTVCSLCAHCAPLPGSCPPTPPQGCVCVCAREAASCCRHLSHGFLNTDPLRLFFFSFSNAVIKTTFRECA